MEPLRRGLANAVTPAGVVKSVKNGEVDISLPVKAGDLIPGKLSASQDTVVHLTLQVRNGLIDFSKSQMKFEPGLTGFRAIALESVKMTADGRAEVELPGLPNPVIGNAAPAKLTDFVDQLQTADSFPVRVLGLTVSHLGKKDGQPAMSPTESAAPRPEELTGLLSKVSAANARVSVKDVEFNDGQIPLASGGFVRIAPGTKLSLKGSLADLRLTGHAKLLDLDFNSAGTTVRGGQGSADVDVHFTGSPTTGGTVETRLTNLDFKSDYTVSRRPNGDFVEFAQGTVRDGTIQVTHTLDATGTVVGDPTINLSLDQFVGTVTQGQITVPDGDGTATIRLGRSSVKGRVEVNEKHVKVSGDVEVDARVSNLDTPNPQARLSFSDVQVTGHGQGSFDSERGIDVEGTLRVKGGLERGAIGVKAGEGELTKSTFDLTATKVRAERGGSVDIRGEGEVSVGFKNADAGDKGLSLTGGSGTVTGRGRFEVNDETGVRVSNGALRLTASVEDGRIALGDTMTMDLKAGTRLESAVSSAVFARGGVALDLGRTVLDATLDQGTVLLPSGLKLAVRDGARLELILDKLSLPQKGIPQASGRLELKADLGANQVDPNSLLSVPGLALGPIEGLNQSLRVRMGRFNIEKSGKFDLENISVGIEANIRRFGGVIR